MASEVASRAAAAYRTDGAALVLYARQWLGDDEAEDVVHEAFVQVMTRAKWPEDARPWLFRVVRNAAMSRLRSRVRRRKREQAVCRGEWFEGNAGEGLDALAAQSALAGLALPQREIVTLRIWGGLRFAEIARVMELPLSTVHDQYRDALVGLRERMEHHVRTPQ